MRWGSGRSLRWFATFRTTFGASVRSTVVGVALDGAFSSSPSAGTQWGKPYGVDGISVFMRTDEPFVFKLSGYGL